MSRRKGGKSGRAVGSEKTKMFLRGVKGSARLSCFPSFFRPFPRVRLRVEKSLFLPYWREKRKIVLADAYKAVFENFSKKILKNVCKLEI